MPARRAQGVDGNAEPLENQLRDDDGKRDGGQHDERRPKIEEEQKQDDDHQNEAVAEGFLDVFQRVLDEVFLLKNFGVEPHVGRQRRVVGDHDEVDFLLMLHVERDDFGFVTLDFWVENEGRRFARLHHCRTGKTHFVGLFRRVGVAFFEFHVAFRAVAGLVFDHFGVHRADVGMGVVVGGGFFGLGSFGC